MPQQAADERVAEAARVRDAHLAAEAGHRFAAGRRAAHALVRPRPEAEEAEEVARGDEARDGEAERDDCRVVWLATVTTNCALGGQRTYGQARRR